MFVSDVKSIISGNEQLAAFWSNSHGWAPESSANLISKSRLDWQVSLSMTLFKWQFEASDHSGDLILAWANLGALVEGSLKLLLSVYYEDYSYDPHRFLREEKQIDPDILTLEKLKLFLYKKDLLNDNWYQYLELVQHRRNAIHAFKDRSLGNSKEFHDCVGQYLQLLREINGMLPYPDDRYSPAF
ncbi:hypothetical protein [Halomonas sp.]|uniref:hypothetical protein n=1 Tax=Halomonas sp. TaxID=1486246 RepID=UPI00257ABA2C|nr:hypothetical protein [Halomonas sp.]MCJ8283946.1 hypothetical protein [Halomonas sp.]NQY68999.1 hypothetical protein [Halomonas sp.]